MAIFVGGSPRLKGMERKDLIGTNTAIFKNLGKALNEVGSPECRVCVVANPANTNCLFLSKHAPNIPKDNFSALTRLDHDRAVAQIALRTNSKVKDVEDVFVWGNHSPTQYPDARYVKVKGKPLNYREDRSYYQGEYIHTVQNRGAAIISARALSSSMSAANAVNNHMRDWYLGSNSTVSMGLISNDNKYNVPEDLCFSYPVKCSGNFKHQIVEDIMIDPFSQHRIDITTQELLLERQQGSNR